MTSPKTEHHKGHEQRVIPMFPELQKPLRKVSERAAEKVAPAITRYRSANQNLRTTFTRIAKQAGVIPWPKPFQNLRSTRETELMGICRAHVVCQWIGNSEAVARKHYLQVTDAHFEKAVVKAAPSVVGHQVGHKACEMTQTGELAKETNPENTSVFRGSAAECASVTNDKITRPGLEPGTTEPKSVVGSLVHRRVHSIINVFKSIRISASLQFIASLAAICTTIYAEVVRSGEGQRQIN